MKLKWKEQNYCFSHTVVCCTLHFFPLFARARIFFILKLIFFHYLLFNLKCTMYFVSFILIALIKFLSSLISFIYSISCSYTRHWAFAQTIFSVDFLKSFSLSSSSTSFCYLVFLWTSLDDGRWYTLSFVFSRWTDISVETGNLSRKFCTNRKEY